MDRSGIFNADVRNLGGRKVLVEQIYNHRSALSLMKSSLNTLEWRISLVKKKNQLNPAEQKDIEDEKNARQLKVRVNSAKKMIDTNKPTTFDKIRKGQPSGASSKQQQFLMGEHFKNLMASQSRINSYGSMNSRKKNFYDSQAYPSLFFRRIKDNIENTKKKATKSSQSARTQKEGIISYGSIGQNYFVPSTAQIHQSNSGEKGNKLKSYSLQSQSTKQLQNSTAGGTLTAQLLKSSPNSNSKQYSLQLNHSSTNPLNKLSPTSSAQLQQQIQQQQINQMEYEEQQKLDQEQQLQNESQHGQQQQLENPNPETQNITQMKTEEKWSNIVEEIPVLLDINEESINLLKQHLVNLILQFRLYKQQDYEAMKEVFINKNPLIDKELVNAIFQEIIEAFDE